MTPFVLSLIGIITVDCAALGGLITCPSWSAPTADVFGKHPVWSLCCSADINVQNQPWSGWGSQLIKGLQRDVSEVHPSSFVSDFDDGSLRLTLGKTIVEEVQMVQWWEEGERGGEHVTSSAAEIASWHQKLQHVKIRCTAPPCLSHFISPPPPLPCYQGEGLTLPTLVRRGWCKSSPVSPLSHSWWLWHKKKEKWKPWKEREG